MDNLMRVAAFLGAMRSPGRQVPVVAAQTLVLIASGVDSVPELQEAMGLNPAGVNRAISLLRGRSRFSCGKFIESPYRRGLVVTRRHPHRRGLQLLLTEEGHELIQRLSTFEPVEPDDV